MMCEHKKLTIITITKFDLILGLFLYNFHMEMAEQRINEWIRKNDLDQDLDLSRLSLKLLPDLPQTFKRPTAASPRRAHGR